MPHFNVCTLSPHVSTTADCLLKVVEQELARIPRQLGSLVKQQLWSILYMPQVCALILLRCYFAEGASYACVGMKLQVSVQCSTCLDRDTVLHFSSSNAALE